MTEVTCLLSNTIIPATSALEFTQAGDQTPKHVGINVVLELIQNSQLLGIILERIALNQGLYTEIVSIRKQAAAMSKGTQEGANKAVDALRKAVQESGLDPLFFEDLVQKTFNSSVTSSELEETK